MNSSPQIQLEIITGDLLKQPDADAIVNPWNRNFVPRLLLLPHGVSGALKKQTGSSPWKALAKKGLMKTGEAYVTDGGKLSQNLIHVAGLNLFWVSTPESIQKAAVSAIEAAWERGYKTIAMPLIGAGVGGQTAMQVENLIKDALAAYISSDNGAMVVRLVLWDKQ